MRKTIVAVAVITVCLLLSVVAVSSQAGGGKWANVRATDTETAVEMAVEPPTVNTGGFEIEVLVDGRPLDEYYARGRRYIEALEGAEYELRIRNPLGVRVAVALAVDGLNTIDARRSSAADSSKWVIEPYQTITISGWQMNSARARRFYFTSESNSYGAKLGQTANLGVITAAFFRERQAVGVVVPPPRRPRPMEDGGVDTRDKSAEEPSASAEGPSTSAGRDERAGAQARKSQNYPVPDDDYAATGIGRNVRNDVRWINLELESSPTAELTIRYEYHDALVKLGVLPRPFPRPEPLNRRERATGFTERNYCPEP